MKIEINEHNNLPKVIKPNELHGMKEKQLYVMCNIHGVVDINPTYFITCGVNCSPIMIWYYDEEKEYCLQPSTKADLNQYKNHIYVKKCENADISLTINIKYNYES